MDNIVLTFKKEVENLIDGFAKGKLELYGEDYASDEFLRKILKLYVSTPQRIIHGRFFLVGVDKKGAAAKTADSFHDTFKFLKKIKGLEGFEPPKEVRQWFSDHGSKKEKSHEK